MVPITHSPGIQAPGESVTDSSMRMDIELQMGAAGAASSLGFWYSADS